MKESSLKEKETSHEISLQQEVSLCDVSMQGLKKLQSVETPMQCKSLLNNGLIQSFLMPCCDPMVMVPKSNGNHFKKEDKKSSFRQSKVVKRGQCKNIHNNKQEWFVWILMLYVLCSTFITYMYLNYAKKESFLEEIVHLGDINMFRKFSYAHVIYEGKLFDVLKISKYKLGFTSLMHLGHDIGGGKLKASLSKLDAIVDW